MYALHVTFLPTCGLLRDLSEMVEKYFGVLMYIFLCIYEILNFGVEGVTLVVSEQVGPFGQCVMCLLCF